MPAMVLRGFNCVRITVAKDFLFVQTTDKPKLNFCSKFLVAGLSSLYCFYILLFKINFIWVQQYTTVLEIFHMGHVLFHLQAFTLASLSSWNTPSPLLFPSPYPGSPLLSFSDSAYKAPPVGNFPQTEAGTSHGSHNSLCAPHGISVLLHHVTLHQIRAF